MIRYRLDDLGWHQFEWLVQSVLKAELGLGVESWGGRGDFGRDAYCRDPLRYPSKDVRSQGPFVFQAKFIESANAAGANFDGPLVGAVRKEAAKIAVRMQPPGWLTPQHYVLLTNAPLSAASRRHIKDLIHKVIPQARVHAHGANDICDLLDEHVELRRSFPQLLSLRDLDELIRHAVSNEILDRSQAALDCARDVVPVFVPTSAYNKAWQVLRKNHFVVLEGPPEMGKSAIAWIIALAQLSQGWQAIVCDEPPDFFKSYQSKTHQVFVADDAFGRTEYDPTRGSKWEKQLNRINRQLDSKHWLIWTSRKHILERAKRAMDLEGETSDFPQPGQILVSAVQLSKEEKALILYRHARAAGLEKEAKSIVRQHARYIVGDDNFTPERIRRFVKETLPEVVVQLRMGHLEGEEVLSEIREAIRNPTGRMRKTFRALPASHKWFLIALLEAGRPTSPENVKESYESICPSPVRDPFERVLEELTESFVRLASRRPSKVSQVDWIHPSYRDLIIEELLNQPSLHMHFLRSMSLQGIKLAISEAGGKAGERRFPLVTTPRSWEVLHQRCATLVREWSTQDIVDLLKALNSAARAIVNKEISPKLRSIISDVCNEARALWDNSSTVLSSDELSTYCAASLLATPLPSLPRLDASWRAAHDKVLSELDRSEGYCVLDPDPLLEWIRLVRIIQSNEPRLLTQVEFPDKHIEHFHRLFEILETEVSAVSYLDSSDESHAESVRFASLAELLRSIALLVPVLEVQADQLTGELERKSSSYLEEAIERQEEEPDYDDYARDISPGGDSFDVDALFSDL